MNYIEMSRDESHGGGEWGFTKCLWSPSRKENGQRWAYWETLLRVKTEDVVFHLRGRNKDINFVGFSSVNSEGYETKKRPPIEGEWNYAKTFYKVQLKNFIPFEKPINLREIFEENDLELRDYFISNKFKKEDKRRLFYVIQNNKLRCQNGAYLSELDDQLLNLLFHSNINSYSYENDPIVIKEAKVGESFNLIRTRIGQKQFSDNVKKNFHHNCCFPNCDVNDSRFLVGGHIARWTDSPELRGDITNGVCLCVLHDKAFEIGLFTINNQYKIVVNQNFGTSEWIKKYFNTFNGKKIKNSEVKISLLALKQHWERHSINLEND